MKLIIYKSGKQLSMPDNITLEFPGDEIIEIKQLTDEEKDSNMKTRDQDS